MRAPARERSGRSAQARGQGLRLLPVLLMLLWRFPASAQDTHVAAQFLRQGRADEALRILEPMTRQAPTNAEAQNLLCRVYYQERRWDEAAAACQAAAQADPHSSLDAMWLGRALGEQAQRANPVTAYKLARQVRQNFETAVQLDGSNVAALRDLGEFYNDAPIILGGGSKKSQEIASRLQPLDPGGAHWLRGHIAEAGKDTHAAEREFRDAITATSNKPMAWVDLASFLARQGRADDAVAAIREEAQHDSHDSSALYDGASVLLRLKRELPLAEELLLRYIRGNNHSEDAPLFVAHERLARVYAQQGDTQKSEAEQNSAHALARGLVEGAAR